MILPWQHIIGYPIKTQKKNVGCLEYNTKAGAITKVRFSRVFQSWRVCLFCHVQFNSLIKIFVDVTTPLRSGMFYLLLIRVVICLLSKIYIYCIYKYIYFYVPAHWTTYGDSTRNPVMDKPLTRHITTRPYPPHGTTQLPTR